MLAPRPAVHVVARYVGAILLFFQAVTLAQPQTTGSSRQLSRPLFASTCVGLSDYRDTSTGDIFTCPAGAACMCTRFRADDGSWNCAEGEDPCRNLPHATPRYPTNSFQASLTASLYDGSSLTNVTSLWLHDGGNRRERVDSLMWERAPPPDAYFNYHAARQVTTEGVTYEVRSEFMGMKDARCDGVQSSVDDEARFSGTAAVGSINRFLPRDLRLYPKREDRFLGYESVGTRGGERRCSAWGWAEHDPRTGRETGAHKVLVAVRTGWPVAETQYVHPPGNSNAITAEVDFTFDFDGAGNSGMGNSGNSGAPHSGVAQGWFLGLPDVEGNIFAVPEGCPVRQPARRREPQAGSPDAQQEQERQRRAALEHHPWAQRQARERSGGQLREF